MERIWVRYRAGITLGYQEYIISFKLPVLLRYAYNHISKNGTNRADVNACDKVKIINQLLYWESKSGKRAGPAYWAPSHKINFF